MNQEPLQTSSNTDVNVVANTADKCTNNTKDTHDIPRNADELQYNTYEEERGLIEEQISDDVPIGYKMLPLSVINMQYKGNRLYSAQATLLQRKYKGFREVSRDGNCFYRAYMFSILENLMQENSPDLWEKLIQSLDKTFETMSKYHEPFIIEEFFEQLKELINKVRSPIEKMTSDKLAKLVNSTNDGYDLCLQYTARLACSAYMREHIDDIFPFLPENATLDSFITKEVEPIGREADNIQIMSTAQQLGFGVRIVCLDPSIVEKPKKSKTISNQSQDTILPVVESSNSSASSKVMSFIKSIFNCDNTRGQVSKHSSGPTSATHQDNKSTVPNIEGPTEADYKKAETLVGECHEVVMPDGFITRATLLFRPGHYEILYHKT